LIPVDPVILESARKHGISDDDMLHAYRNPIRVFEMDGLAMLIGPDHSARMLEIGVARGEGIEFIVHAMSAREKFLR
jgi:hypothetical protein